MKYRGVIIEESLSNMSVLKEVTVLDQKIEPVTDKHRTPWVKQWSLDTVEIPEDSADAIAEMLSNSIDDSHGAWYADYKNDAYHYIVYPHKVFKVDLSDPKLYGDARQWGIDLGIPDYQVDFGPQDKVWERKP